MKNAFFFLIVFAGFRTYGQDWFSQHKQGDPVKGYIITIAGDTLPGSIRYDYPVIMQKRISFTRSEDGNSVTYQAKDIRGYSCAGQNWVSATVNIETYNGPIKFDRFGILYSGRGPLQLLRIFPEKDKVEKKMSSSKAETIYKGISTEESEKSFDDLYIKKFETPAESVTSQDFKKDFSANMSRYVSEDKDLMNKLNNKGYRYADLLKVVKEFNEWFLQNKYSRQ